MNRKTVLITGASTGIGFGTALEMAKQGYHVIAGVRKEADAQKLIQASQNAQNAIQPIILDVTKPEDIQLAYSKLSTQLQDTGLYALINNSGIIYAAPFEYTDEQKARNMMEVNFFGLYKMTQIFLPLLHDYRRINPNQRPKIIHIGSIGSAIGLPWESFYHASKFAVYGLAESSRIELTKLGIAVSIVMPGGVKTEIFRKSNTDALAALSALPADAPSSYAEGVKAYTKAADQLLAFATTPEIAGKRITSLLKKRKAPFYILIGRDARIIYLMTKILPRQWLQNLIGSIA